MCTDTDPIMLHPCTAMAALEHVASPPPTGLGRVAASADVAAIVKRYMLNSEIERLEQQQNVLDDVYDRIGYGRADKVHEILDDINTLSIHHTMMKMDHIKRLIEIRDMWGGVGGNSSLADTADMPPMRCAPRSRFEIDQQRRHCRIGKWTAQIWEFSA